MPMVGIASAADDLRREVGGHALEHQREGARLLGLARRGEQPLARRLAAALHLEAAELVHRLRRQAEVRHHRHLGGDQRAHHVGAVALDLHRLRAALLEEAQGVGDRLLGAEVERAVRHVGDEQRPLARRAAPL